MSTLLDTPTPAERRTRSHVLRVLLVTLSAGALLLLIGHFAVAPSWVLWAVPPIAVVAALAMFVAGQLSWERTLSSAQAAGLVARPDERA